MEGVLLIATIVQKMGNVSVTWASSYISPSVYSTPQIWNAYDNEAKEGCLVLRKLRYLVKGRFSESDFIPEADFPELGLS